ncbi:zinc-binding dehydrogenase [Pseudonocardia humida]|uniref:Zinc-binding dehydrogenase n=1 Tax=Pseudonocardia humida TaxID=2800819 RepID=A0ABT0ZZ76_9PSEU|nr:zinc-binding dehydrogenase [Pseudonocardia humida]MCO1656035.1 zinc-binding dehydrogenase [Pseudonocardia humida]
MKAIRQHEFGGPDTLRYEEVPDPVPGPGRVRIAVAAAGVHLLDTFIRAGRAGGPFPLPALPMTPGREVAGTVEALGPGVDDAWRGRAVVAHLGQAHGGYAQLAVADVTALHAVPDGLSPAEAVAMIGSGRTAVGILRVAAIGPDDVVLVPAAAGGMGALFVQAARNAGAKVVGLAGGPAKTATVRGLGADVAEDYRDPGWPERVRAALDGAAPTLLLDGVGGEVGRAALDLLGVGSRMVMFGWSSGSITPFTSQDVAAKSLQVTWVTGPRMLAAPGGLRGLETEALAAAGRGELVALVHPPFALGDAAGAHAALEARATAGKVVLAP